MTDDDLRGWESVQGEKDLDSELHRHFEAKKYKLRHWCAVADEARRLYSLMFGNVEQGSAIDDLLSATAAAAAETVILAIARALGMRSLSIERGLEDWIEYKKIRKPVSAEEFVELCKTRKCSEWAIEQRKPAP